MGVLNLSAGAQRWHRRLSLLAGTALILWAGSGLLHPLMSWTNPRPVAFAPPVGEPLSLPAVQLAQISALPLVSARLLSQNGRQLWQLQLAERSGLQYVDAQTGQIASDADRERALLLARYYTGQHEVVAAQEITSFSREYPAVNRLLPVWRVEFAGAQGLRAYVHTGEDRLGALNDRRKLILLRVFQFVHTLDFLDGAEGLRLGLVLAAVGSVLAMTMLGGVLLLRLPRARTLPGPRRVHRLLGWAVWLPVLMLSVSGLFHLGVQSPLRANPPESPRVSPAPSLLTMPPSLVGARSVHLLSLTPDGAVWRARQAPEDLRIHDALTGAPLAGGDAQLARRLAGADDAADVVLLTGFSTEYAFANKRLPVWRVQTPQGLVFVDAASGVIAARVRPLDVVEQWTFSTLHKWQFLDPLGHVPRDALLSLAALSALLLTMFGLRLRSRQRLKS